jgi:hypothetical protein
VVETTVTPRGGRSERRQPPSVICAPGVLPFTYCRTDTAHGRWMHITGAAADSIVCAMRLIAGLGSAQVSSRFRTTARHMWHS